MHGVESLEKQNKVLHCLQCLPRKIVSLHNDHDHDHGNLSEFVLYDLCHESCFDIAKAAYLVNNPDFHCLKGITGICKHEPGYCCEIKDIWQEPRKYIEYMSRSPFNQKVRSIEREHIHNGQENAVVGEIAQQLGLERPECIKWDMKHGNNGYLIFEPNTHTYELIKQYLPETVHLLGFCPIY